MLCLYDQFVYIDDNDIFLVLVLNLLQLLVLINIFIDRIEFFVFLLLITVLLGIILKMACLTKDGSLQGQRFRVESFSKAPSKTLIIPSSDLVQVIAKVAAFHIFAVC